MHYKVIQHHKGSLFPQDINDLFGKDFFERTRNGINQRISLFSKELNLWINSEVNTFKEKCDQEYILFANKLDKTIFLDWKLRSRQQAVENFASKKESQIKEFVSTLNNELNQKLITFHNQLNDFIKSEIESYITELEKIIITNIDQLTQRLQQRFSFISKGIQDDEIHKDVILFFSNFQSDLRQLITNFSEQLRKGYAESIQQFRIECAKILDQHIENTIFSSIVENLNVIFKPLVH
ncbi:MAG: hypothetical protein ABIH39_01630 [Candidatus Margulisiibacteriota bacterium]